MAPAETFAPFGATASCKASLLLLILLSAIGFLSVCALDFEVGDDKGWEVPPSKNAQFYNEWASMNRFRVDDTLVFKYKKDSVMVVTEGDYESCNSSHPTFFDNKGMTEVQLDHSGAFYFISGNAGHCQMGQKMIVRVLSGTDELGSSSSQANQTGTTPSGPSSGATAMPAGRLLSPFGWLFLMVGPFFF
uniref:Early nodulin-like protein 1 n=1 Tax=Anthurium amnicola TaxID=1678845 RepID=A0A1D1YAL9_9ARAE